MLRFIVVAVLVAWSSLCVSHAASAKPYAELPDSSPPGKPHFDTKGAKVGDQLPDLPLYSLDGKPTSLATLWSDGPTLLLTSSYTCPRSRQTEPLAAALAQSVAGRGVKVAIVYVIEAHPAGDPSPYAGVEEVTDENRRDRILCRQPRTRDERLKLAGEFAARFKLTLSIAVDPLDNSAWAALGGGPNMGVLVDSHGIVMARQGWFDAPSMAEAIGTLVPRGAAATALTRPSATDDSDAALHTLVVDANTKALKALLAGQPGLRDRFLKTYRGEQDLLQIAAEYGKLDVVRLIVESGANVNRQSETVATPLHLAAEGGYVEVARYLLSHGAEVDPREQGYGPTPLQDALFLKKAEVSALLVSAGAKPNIYTAAATGDLQALQREFLHDPTTALRPDGRGRSPLVYAAASGQLDAAKLLLSLGVKDLPANKDEAEAAYWASRQGDLEMTGLLLDGSSDPNLFDTVINDMSSIAFVRMMLQHKADPNHLTRRGMRPLHTAAAYDRTDIVQLLTDAGADVNGRTTDQSWLMCGPIFQKDDTPLLVAAENGNVASVELLLKRHADARAWNADGSTALHYAVRNSRGVGARLARLLIDGGADVNRTDYDGRTPLDAADGQTGQELFGLTAEQQLDRAAVIALLKSHGAVHGKAVTP